MSLYFSAGKSISKVLYFIVNLRRVDFVANISHREDITVEYDCRKYCQNFSGGYYTGLFVSE